MNRLAFALAVILVANLVPAARIGAAPVSVGLQVVSGEPAPSATTDDWLFDRSDFGPAVRSPLLADILAP